MHGIGQIRSEHYYDPVKLALATGIQSPIPFMISRLLDELKNVTDTDPLADIQPAHGFHFTFLPRYKINEPLPENVEQQQKLWHEFHGRKIVIRRLRLVALPSQSLLAGFPGEPAMALCQSFCEKFLKTPRRQALLLRHNHRPLPARSGTARFCVTVRLFYLQPCVNFLSNVRIAVLARWPEKWR